MSEKIGGALALKIGKAVIALLITISPSIINAQEKWPTKPIRLIVPWGAGGGVDLAARIFCEPLGAALGQPCIVENKPGAAGNIGTDAVAKAKDGHTFGIISASPLTVAKLLNPKLPFNAQTELQPISMAVMSPLVVVVPNSIGGDTPKQILTELKNLSGKLNFGSSGVGSAQHLGFVSFMEVAGIEGTHVPYSGGGQAIVQGLLDGSIQTALMPVNVANPHIKAGKLKAIGISSASPNSILAPGIPTLSSAGIDFDFAGWNAFMAPSTMPKSHVERLNHELHKIMQKDDVKQRLLTAGWEVKPTSPQEVQKYIDNENKLLGGIIKRKGIVLE